MDNLTHTLIGVAVARAGVSNRLGRGSTLALAVASNLPDIDVLTILTKGENFLLYRRMVTHSLLGILILSILGAFIFQKFYPKISFRNCFLLFLTGISLHVFFDLVNSFGVVLLYPFSMKRYELSWVYIIDLAIWAILLMPFFLTLFRYTHNTWVWKICLTSLSLYVFLCAVSHSMAYSLLQKRTHEEGLHPEFCYVFPEPFGFHRFRGIVKEGHTYHTYLLYILKAETIFKKTDTTEDDSLNIKSVRQTSLGKRLDWFFKAPLWREISAQEIEVLDLRFRSEILMRNKTPFTYTFSLKEKLNAEKN